MGNLKREHIKGFYIGNKHKKHIYICYYKNILNILSISFHKNIADAGKRIFDRKMEG